LMERHRDAAPAPSTNAVTYLGPETFDMLDVNPVHIRLLTEKSGLGPRPHANV
jgi:hypothetical protein